MKRSGAAALYQGMDDSPRTTGLLELAAGVAAVGGAVLALQWMHGHVSPDSVWAGLAKVIAIVVPFGLVLAYIGLVTVLFGRSVARTVGLDRITPAGLLMVLGLAGVCAVGILAIVRFDLMS